MPPHSQVATVSRPPRPRGIKASCPGDVRLTDTLAKEEATPAVDAITHTHAGRTTLFLSCTTLHLLRVLRRISSPRLPLQVLTPRVKEYK
ncbi:hypothetical protein Pmani_006720 [Petrolisthes manimaculis]|uniref:Uncharacterized protein n=1 Tax=Petrolisthes manimaculis TaxID=1843537 RepID=A0AAE1QAF0_9EUCA|nr:hypothetical protein Pmani_006720 [Petrolisthes manimaculis]